MNDADRDRYAEQQKREQDERDQEHRARVTTMEKIEHLIFPLKFAPLKEGATEPAQLSRPIISEEGEKVGHLSYQRMGYGYRSKERFRLSSPRIPARSRYRHGDGYRNYQKFDSVILAIQKFCLPVSDDETRAKVLREELRHYRDVLQQSNRRHLHIEGTGYASPNVDGFIRLLASDIKQDQLEGQEFIRILVRKKRVHLRFHKWVMEHFITPRQDELNALDTSKEVIK